MVWKKYAFLLGTAGSGVLCIYDGKNCHLHLHQVQKAASRAEAARAARSCGPQAREERPAEEVKDEPRHNGDASTSGERPGGASPLSPKKPPPPADVPAGEFSWKEYLLETHATAAHPAAFRQVEGLALPPEDAAQQFHNASFDSSVQ